MASGKDKCFHATWHPICVEEEEEKKGEDEHRAITALLSELTDSSRTRTQMTVPTSPLTIKNFLCMFCNSSIVLVATTVTENGGPASH